MACPYCMSQMVKPDSALSNVPTVTSDCRFWTTGKSVRYCAGCGVMKRDCSTRYANGVYKNYKSYPEPAGRTKAILEFIKNKLPEPKSILDVGTGTGHGLVALSGVFPKAIARGYEPNTTNPKILKSFPKDKYDLITLFHVLEHVNDPHEMMETVYEALPEKGNVLIQVPYTVRCPFDLVIADHVWHFTLTALSNLLKASGFSPKYMGTDVVRKEITILADKSGDGKFTYDEINPKKVIRWILDYSESLKRISCMVNIYGTGPAAAWAGNILGERVVYYLDDDKKRHGLFNNRPVISPSRSKVPIVAPFPDYQLNVIKKNNPELEFI